MSSRIFPLVLGETEAYWFKTAPYHHESCKMPRVHLGDIIFKLELAFFMLGAVRVFKT